jgi:hypothetical protein
MLLKLKNSYPYDDWFLFGRLSIIKITVKYNKITSKYKIGFNYGFETSKADTLFSFLLAENKLIEIEEKFSLLDGYISELKVKIL